MSICWDKTDVVMVTMPAYAERIAADVCAPYLKSGQTVYLSSGAIYESVSFFRKHEKLEITQR